MLSWGSAIVNFFAAQIDALVNVAPVGAEEKTRLRHYAVLVAVGCTTMLVYGLYNLFLRNFLLSFWIFLSVGGLYAGLFFLRRLADGRIVYRLNTILFSSLILYLLYTGGEYGSKSLWMYTFPLIAFFLFGKTEGLFWSGLVFALALGVLYLPVGWPQAHAYPPEFKIRFATTYLIVSAITYWFEYFRNSYRLKIEQQNLVLEQEKEQLNQEISVRRRLESELSQLANTDPLTGVANRRYFWEEANKEISRHQRYTHALTLLVMDIDRFKNINDTFGHPSGDEVLKALVRYCGEHLRSADIFARIGGDEFAVLLVETDETSARMVAERVREKLAALRIRNIAGEMAFTVSIGLAGLLEQEQNIEPLFKRADHALYQAKDNGRNRVEIVAGATTDASAPTPP